MWSKKRTAPALYLEAEALMPYEASVFNATRPINTYDLYTPGVAQTLASLSLELVWCSEMDTFDRTALTVREASLRGHRGLRLQRAHGRDVLQQKFDAICRDQLLQARPFVVVDPNLTDAMQARLEYVFEAVSPLIVIPSHEYGVFEDQLDDVTRYAEAATQRT